MLCHIIAHSPLAGSAFHAHHFVFVLLHGALLGWFLYSVPRFPRFLLGLGGGITSFTIGCHMLLSSMCSSPTVATAVFDYVASSPLSRAHRAGEGREGRSVSWLTNVGWVINGLVTAAVAMHFVKLELKGTPRVAKLLIGLLICLSLATVWKFGEPENADFFFGTVWLVSNSLGHRNATQPQSPNFLYYYFS